MIEATLVEVILIVTITFTSGEVFHSEYTQPNYTYCKTKESVMHSSFSRRENIRSLFTTCGKQYRIIYWIDNRGNQHE